MEWNDLYNFVVLLVLTGLIIGIGIATFSSMRTYTATSDGTVYFQNFTLGDNSLIFNYTTLYLAYPYVSIINVTNSTSEESCGLANWANGTYYSVSPPDKFMFLVNDTESSCIPSSIITVQFTFKDTNTSTGLAMAEMSGNLVNVSVDWLPLIVVVAILVIIMGIVISSFAGRGRR